MSDYRVAASCAALEGGQEHKLLLGGQLVFASLQADCKPPTDFVAQRPREACSGLLAKLNKHRPKIYVYHHPKLLTMPKARCALLLDAYLAWGCKQKASVVLIGGMARLPRMAGEEGGFQVDVLVFEAGRLIALYDQELPARSSPRFALVTAAMLARIRERYPHARIVQAAPLDDWQLADVEYLGEQPLRGLSFRPIRNAASGRHHFLLPASIVVLAALCNFTAIALTFSQYRAAVARYELAASDPLLIQHGKLDAKHLNLLAQRKDFMASPRAQDGLPANVQAIVHAIALLPDVQIIELKIFANPATHRLPPSGSADSVPNAVPDLRLRLSLPKSSGPALEQAHAVLAKLAANSGISLRLTPRGWQEDQKRRIFSIEGWPHA